MHVKELFANQKNLQWEDNGKPKYTANKNKLTYTVIGYCKYLQFNEKLKSI